MLSLEQLTFRIRDFNYGYISRKSKPSSLKIQKDNLNQNATQSYYLMINLPFILYDVKNELEEVWICVQSLLKVMQIIYSNSIRESDVRNLNELIKTHLESHAEKFKGNLKPKHHF